MRAPRFWFNPKDAPGIVPRLLHPLSILWRLGSDRRMRRGKHVRVDVPVVCVGNINVGGTGKTPTVIELLMIFSELGKKAHVVSRGYGGAITSPTKVEEAVHSADDVGDEPLLLAAFGTCWVAQDRLAGAKAAISDGAEVLILDDGMQNPDLQKDFTIMVVDAAVGFGNGRLLPAGPLRQSISDGVLASDLVLSIGSLTAQQKFSKDDAAGLARLDRIEGSLTPLETGMQWPGLRAFAFAGIGRPEKFFETLQDCGADIVQTRSFGDHQKIPIALLRRMETEAAKMNAQMVTTEKDAVRLPKEFSQKVLTLPVRLQIEDRDVLTQKMASLLENF